MKQMATERWRQKDGDRKMAWTVEGPVSSPKTISVLLVSEFARLNDFSLEKRIVDLFLIISFII